MHVTELASWLTAKGFREFPVSQFSFADKFFARKYTEVDPQYLCATNQKLQLVVHVYDNTKHSQPHCSVELELTAGLAGSDAPWDKFTLYSLTDDEVVAHLELYSAMLLSAHKGAVDAWLSSRTPVAIT